MGKLVQVFKKNIWTNFFCLLTDIFIKCYIIDFIILVKNKIKQHQAELAQTDAEYKRSRCGRKTKLSDELKQKILNHLRLSWSPGMIAHEFKLATKSIYNWLNQGRIGFSLNDLPEHGVRQRRNVDQRSKYNQSLGRSIEQRPMMINQRNRIGDFELDTVVGPRGHSKAVLLTLIDRKSRFLWAYRLKDRTTATVNEALTKFLTTFNESVKYHHNSMSSSKFIIRNLFGANYMDTIS